MPVTTNPFPYATLADLTAANLNDLRTAVANYVGAQRVRSKAQAIELLTPLLPPPPPRTAQDVKARMADVVIRVMVDQNPYRPGSKASEHFAKMVGGITIRDYLAKFSEENQKTARQWLYNATKSNYVKTLGGEA